MTHLVSTRDKLLLLVVKLVAQTVPRSDRLKLNVLVEQLQAEHIAEAARAHVDAVENAR